MGSLTNLSKEELISFFKTQANIEYEGNKLYDGTGTHLLQNPYELADLITWIQSLQPDYIPSTLLEIGYCAGITNTILNKVFDFKNITSIDHVSLGGCPNPSTFVANLKFKPITFIAGDSTSKESINKAKLLGPYNLLFIDGGHTQEILKSDYENYKQLLSPNSIIVIHDIISTAFPDLNIIWHEFLSNLPSNAVVKEFTSKSAPIKLGIGAIHIPLVNDLDK